jgi:2-dehydro-3-deoxyphosphooctonate aldolase (KDO 8-P synthase)
MKVIAGPCQHENFELSYLIAKECMRVCHHLGVDYYFKASFDKANRTDISSLRGLGLSETMLDFRRMKRDLPELKILTDVHDRNQIEQILHSYQDCIDVLQIPAFLCRQTDLILDACATGKIVNIKKGQFLSPWEVAGILSKTRGASEVWITERGTSFGYNTLVVDFTGIEYMLEEYEVPIFFDATHSVQKPGALGNSSGGNRSRVRGLLRAASALGVQNFFIETHPNPDASPSDGPNMLKLEDFYDTINEVIRFNHNK